MLRDASHRQVIQKFSFIHSLNLSRGINRGVNKENKVHGNKVVTLQQEIRTSFAPADLSLLLDQKEQKSSALMTAATNTWDTNWDESGSNGKDSNLAEITKYSAYPAADNLGNLTGDSQPKKPHYLGKILFALATSYCLFVLWWLFGHQGSKLLTTWTGGKHITLSKSDVEFIDYAARSLETIERKVEANNADSAEDEKMAYIPVYTPAAAPSLPQVANLPLTTPRNSNSPQTSESTAVAEPVPSSEPLKIPAPPPLPPSTPLESNISSASPEKIAAVQPTVKSTLIGILELGRDKSAALVKVDGQTRRVWLGEAINNEGWVLESVSNQSASIGYQGQVRSITVGETF